MHPPAVARAVHWQDVDDGARWPFVAMLAVVGVAVTIAVMGSRSPASEASAATAATRTRDWPTSVAPDAQPVPTAPTSGAVDAAVATTVRRQRRATLAFGGDIIPHLAVGRSAARYGAEVGEPYDFRPMFQHIKPFVSAADLAICHLETPLAFGAGFTGFPRFDAPHQLAEGIAEAGFDGCSLASNHAFDQYEAGVDATLEVMDAAGLGTAGTARSPDEALAITTYEVDGLRIAHLSATYWINGFAIQPGEEWRVDLIDPARLTADATRARRDGADLVVVSLHWGAEYQREPTDEQWRWATDLASSHAVDLIVGHHAHVLQPITWIDDTLVLFGLGNFLSNQEPNCCTVYSQDGALVLVEVGDGPDGPGVLGFEYVPTWVDRTRMQILPVASSLATDEIEQGWIRNQLVASLARTRDSLSLLGAALPEPR